MPNFIYKLVTFEEWTAAKEAGVYHGSAHDRRDGYIHFSTAAQLPATAAKHFRGLENLVLLTVDAKSLGEALRFEPARGGDLFPHLYAPLDLATVVKEEALAIDASGLPILPKLTEMQRS
jgi:uncharacterized protein (DUF952 family)